MRKITVTKAREQFFRLIKDVKTSSDPIRITSKDGDAFLVSAEDWEAVQETLFLMSVSGLRQDILDGMNTPIDKCFDGKDLCW